MAGEGPKSERYLFLDVFRRADKNDDGAISWDEFKNYFADGVLTNDELKKLFTDIDTHNTNNIDVEELCTYFTQHLGPFEDVLDKIEGLNSAVSNALTKSSEVYTSAGFVEQYWTRFLMREILGQLSAVQCPIDAASDVLEERAVEERKDDLIEVQGEVPQASMDKRINGTTSNIIPGRIGRRMKRQISSQTSWTPDTAVCIKHENGIWVGSGALGNQVERLKGLLDRFEKKVSLTGGGEEELNLLEDKVVILVYRKMCVSEVGLKAFRGNLKAYVENLTPTIGCLHASVRTYAGSNVFVMYEVWKDEETWKGFLKSADYKLFQHSKVDTLELPEQLVHMPVPESWWTAA